MTDQPKPARRPPQTLETVVLVEYDDAVRMFIEKILVQRGFVVYAHPTAEEAIDFVGNYDRQLHAVISDVVLPNMSGPTLAARLRELQPSLKALFVSGSSDGVITQESLLGPGTTFLLKPFSPRALLRKIRALLDETAASATREEQASL